MKNLMFLITLSILFMWSCSTSQKTTGQPEEARTEDISTDLTLRIKKLAGVRVVGDRANAQFFISGPNTFSGNTQPLFILDGQQMSSYQDLYFIVNSADIKRIEVLRRPEEISFYGARGANGVIKVTTNRG